MRYYGVVARNWRTVFWNPLLWVFGLFASASYILPTSALQSDDLGYGCVLSIALLFIGALQAIGLVGLIHIADHIPHERALTFRGVWKHSAASYIRVIVINLVLGAVLLIPGMFLLFVFGPEATESLLWLLYMFTISPIVFVIVTLSACGIVITKLRSFDSLKKGVRVFRRHMTDMLLLAATFFAVPTIVTLAGLFVLTTIHFDTGLPSPVPITVQTYNELLRLPAIVAIRSITYFILVPLWTILITLAYKELHWW
jgi:hypothetical protein